MYQKNNDYTNNSKNETAIIYQTAEGLTITLTEKDFSSVTEFLQWKEWSDQDYHETEKAENLSFRIFQTGQKVQNNII